MDISRRDFLKGAAMTAVAGTLSIGLNGNASKVSAEEAAAALTAEDAAETEGASALETETSESDTGETNATEEESAEEETITLNYTDPYMTSLSPAIEMDIMWIVKGDYQGYVEYGPTPALGNRVEATSYRFEGLRTSITPDGYDEIPENNPELECYQLIAELKTLEPGSIVYYRTVTEGEGTEQASDRYYFRTAPLEGESFQFVLLSDMQMKVRTKETIKILGQAEKDFIIFAGDMGNTPWKAGEWFNVKDCYEVPGEDDRSFFECLHQNTENTHLLQYMPIFPCPGNHEFDDQRVSSDKEFAMDDTKWTWKVYMQLFRPLYPEQDYTVSGKRWYSIDYGDLHLCSLSISRYETWDGFEYPGWITKDDISPDSPQVQWLLSDLQNNNSRFKWVVQHWHMLNRGEDGYYPVSTAIEDPDNPGAAIYPDGDYCWDVLRPIYEVYGVNAVNFGHSHVYERYLINGVNYIEAATIGNNYRNTNDPFHFSGNEPVFEENNFRSFLRVTVDENGMTGYGTQASVETSDVATEVGYCGRIFDTYTIAV